MSRTLFALMAMFLMVQSVYAREVAGVQVPESVSVQDTELALSGAGIRTKFMFKIYVGALYVTNLKDRGAEAALAQPGPKSVRLHILYKELSTEQLVEAWNAGFEANLKPAERQSLKPRIDAFDALFPAVKRGDVIRLDFLANGQTEVWINDNRRGVVEGVDFQRAVLAIWFGDKPVDQKLRESMVGST
jgi:hypothetical protein